MRNFSLRKKYQRLHMEAIKALPLIMKDADKDKVRSLTDLLRRYLPKSFFNIVQIISKNNKKSLIAISFRSKIVEGMI